MGDQQAEACRHCAPAGSPSTLRLGERHRLYLVVGGTVWRFWWAHSRAACVASVKAWFSRNGSPRMRVRLATRADLALVEDVG